MGVTIADQGRFMLLFRSALFVGLGSVVATIIYLTPIPDEFPQSCVRRCHELDWPMICRVKMVVEQLPCSGPPPCPLSVNRQIPGPTIQVCENDIVVVDVMNRASGSSLAVHWRGQTLRETPHMDGVAMITQCPILPFTTFQYKFRASQPGTHFWHGNPGSDGMEGIYGALIVKQSETRDVHSSLYDTDEPNHVLLIHVKFNQINIITQGWSGELNMTAGMRHRMRILYAGHLSPCRVTVRVEETPLTVIALDGHPIKPTVAENIQLAYGERVDVIVQVTSHQLHLTAESYGECRQTKSAAVALNIVAQNHALSSVEQLQNAKQVRTTVDKLCEENEAMRCLNEVESVEAIPRELSVPTLDHKMFFFCGVRPLPHDSNATIITNLSDGVGWGAAHINNRTMMVPSSPLMTQMDDIDAGAFCDSPSCVPGEPCECLHVLHIPLHDTVEIILFNQGDGGQVFHLHGNSWWVVGGRQLDSLLRVEEAIALEAQNQLITRNFSSTVIKDTVSVAPKGVVALRFTASNPGYWLVDGELSRGGMQVVLHVGEPSDVPNTPNNYPRCASWVGPEFFLA